jgi:hypothetical protein
MYVHIVECTIHFPRKRQNLYYVKVQERLSTLDASEDYVMTVTSITGNYKVDQLFWYIQKSILKIESLSRNCLGREP